MSVVNSVANSSGEKTDSDFVINQNTPGRHPPFESDSTIQQFPLVLNPEVHTEFCLVFDEKSLISSKNYYTLQVKSRREIELLLLILGKQASVIMDETAHIQHQDVWNWLYGHTYAEIFANLKWSYHEEDEVINIIEKIPLPQKINAILDSTEISQNQSERIERKFVHKTNKECALISKPYMCGNRYYFNGFTKSPEFQIDHHSDHLQGILVFEITRQAVAASTHLAGVPFDGTIIILKSLIQYKKFIEPNEPLIILTIPVLKKRGGHYYAVFNIIQKDKSCVTGYFSCFRYKDNQAYQKHRISQINQEI